jgi:hypothetical protein
MSALLLAAAPALPLHKAGPYVAAAYIVFVVILLVYVAIMAVRLGHNERELAELARDVEAARAGRTETDAEELTERV